MFVCLSFPLFLVLNCTEGYILYYIYTSLPRFSLLLLHTLQHTEFLVRRAHCCPNIYLTIAVPLLFLSIPFTEPPHRGLCHCALLGSLSIYMYIPQLLHSRASFIHQYNIGSVLFFIFSEESFFFKLIKFLQKQSVINVINFFILFLVSGESWFLKLADYHTHVIIEWVTQKFIYY